MLNKKIYSTINQIKYARKIIPHLCNPKYFLKVRVLLAIGFASIASNIKYCFNNPSPIIRKTIVLISPSKT